MALAASAILHQFGPVGRRRGRAHQFTEESPWSCEAPPQRPWAGAQGVRACLDSCCIRTSSSRARRAVCTGGRPPPGRRGDPDCFDFAAQPLVRPPVVLAAVASRDDVVAVGRRGPLDGQLGPVLNCIEVRRALDRVRDGREEHVRIGSLHVLDGGGDVFQLFALVTPHQEHADGDPVILREPHRRAHLPGRDAAFHRVEDPLAAAFRPDPYPMTAECLQRPTASSLCRRSARVIVSNGRCRPRASSSFR